MHKIQKILLKRLLVQNNQRYSTLTRGYDFEDNVVWHLKQLIQKGLIKKLENQYQITVEGVKLVTDFDLPDLEDTGYKTFFLGFLCQYQDKYLIKEHPGGGINFYNLPSGKPRFGEPLEEALIRTFQGNTGVILKPDNFGYLSLHLKTVKTTKGEVLFDDAFAIYEVHISPDDRNKMKLHLQIQWKSVKEIEELPHRWPEIDIYILNGDRSPYLVYDVVSDYVLDS